MTARRSPPRTSRGGWRARREQAADAGLTGVLVTPGPDLLYLTGYAPIAITERHHDARRPRRRASRR